MTDLPRRSWDDIWSMLKQADAWAPSVRISPFASVIHADNSYALPTVAEVAKQAALSPSNDMVWRNVVSDCDDACDIAQGHLAANGMGNLAIGTAWFTAKDADGATIGAHAALIGVTSEGIGWWEPQTGALYPLWHKWMYPEAAMYDITAIIF